MPNIHFCTHGLGINKCKVCLKRYRREYYRAHREDHKKYYREHYRERIEYYKKYSREHHRERREYFREYYREHREYLGIDRNIKTLLNYYTAELNKLNAQIRREWVIPPVPIQGKQIELQNLIDNLKIIKDHTASLPKSIRAQTRRRMMNELLTTEGRLVSWRKPLPRGSDRNQNVNTSIKER